MSAQPTDLDERKLIYLAARIQQAVLYLRSLKYEERPKYFNALAAEIYRCCKYARHRHSAFSRLPLVVESAWAALVDAIKHYSERGWAFEVFQIVTGDPYDVGSLEPDVWWAKDFDGLDQIAVVDVTVEDLMAPLRPATPPPMLPSPPPSVPILRATTSPLTDLPTSTSPSRDSSEDSSTSSASPPPYEHASPRLLSNDPAEEQRLPPDSVVITIPKLRHREYHHAVEKDEYLVGTKTSPQHKTPCRYCGEQELPCFIGTRKGCCVLCTLRGVPCLLLPCEIERDDDPACPRIINEDEDPASFPPDILVVNVPNKSGTSKFIIGSTSSERCPAPCAACHSADVPCMAGSGTHCVLCGLRRTRCVPHVPGVPAPALRALNPRLAQPRRLKSDYDSSLPADAVVVSVAGRRYYLGTARAQRNEVVCGLCHEAEAPCLAGKGSGTCVLCSLRCQRCVPIAEHYSAGPVRRRGRGRGRAQAAIAVPELSKRRPARATMRVARAIDAAEATTDIPPGMQAQIDRRVEMLVARRVQEATESLRKELLGHLSGNATVPERSSLLDAPALEWTDNPPPYQHTDGIQTSKDLSLPPAYSRAMGSNSRPAHHAAPHAERRTEILRGNPHSSGAAFGGDRRSSGASSSAGPPPPCTNGGAARRLELCKMQSEAGEGYLGWVLHPYLLVKITVGPPATYHSKK
ncbi:hypothetical protein FA95DRAFT_1609518 [Auriscalpium vulgare]|uniref:Uncharacterized protein n=1 Tax=Auriscalpium vulgare TaxID=40419 RepID=A0ACB8RH94_9AGAM|nr:hypothetical protein FA95DRAFT_1609518 [Auriscalpium vulgare]